MKVILISGSNGFLGSYLVKHFLDQNYKVIGLKRKNSNDIRISLLKNKNFVLYNIDEIDMQSIFNSHLIDVVINTVCCYGRNNESKVILEQGNFDFPKELLEYSNNNLVKLFINTDTLLPENTNEYSFIKSKFRRFLKNSTHLTKKINLRIEHMYGPYDDENKFIYWLINKLIYSSENINLTSGIQLRDFIFIDDVVSAFEHAVIYSDDFIENYNEFDLISGKLISVKEFVKILIQKLSSLKNIDFEKRILFGKLKYRKNDVMKPILNQNSFIDTNWKPKFSVNDGLDQIVNKL